MFYFPHDAAVTGMLISLESQGKLLSERVRSYCRWKAQSCEQCLGIWFCPAALHSVLSVNV